LEPKFQELEANTWEWEHKFQELEPEFQELEANTWEWAHKFQELEPEFQELEANAWDWEHKFQELEPEFQELEANTWEWAHKFQELEANTQANTWEWAHNISGVSHSNLSWAPLPGPRAQRGVFVRATLEARGLLSTMNPRIFYPIVLDYNDYMEALARKVQEVLDAAEAPFTLLAPTPSQTHPTRSISTTLAQLDPAPHHPTNFGHPHDDVPHHKLPQNFGGFAFGFGGVGFGGSAAT
jgi:hypothetical protein